MAFKDLEVILYDGKVKINYLDKSHRYYMRPRMTFDLPETDPKAWGKATRPKGTTTLLGDTLEKKGLMTWPMGLALKELFGFYDFTNEKGDRMTGFSKDKGSLWTPTEGGEVIQTLNKEEALPVVLSAAQAYQRKQKKGADIGSVVHDAIEHFIKGKEFDIALSYMQTIKESEYETEAHRDQALKDFELDVAQATVAFEQFVLWWAEHTPKLLGAEDLIYSKEFDYCGTFDGLIEMNGKTILCDWKTSNASGSKEACSPQGVYYSYFIQSAAYAMAWEEMGRGKIDDLLIVSCRKDGEFDTVLLSDLGITMEEIILWWRCVITCYRMMDKTKRALWAHGEKAGRC